VFRVYLRGADVTDAVREFAWSAPGTASNNDPGTLRNPLTGDIWQVSVSTEPPSLIPMPATGVNLSATLVGNDVNLIWKTLSEFNTNHFEVERSTDGVSFVRIGEKAAAGNSVSEKSYTYGDANITAAMYYYRLKMVDMDGKVAYSNVARVNKSHIKTIKTFPNPVTDVINIEFASSKGSYTVTLVNQGGQEVKAVKADITNTTQYVRMDRGELPTGMYYVRVKDNASGQVFAEKIIIK
jgi:archaellum component FlaF (FlaF/FlaG flagellin family)